MNLIKDIINVRKIVLADFLDLLKASVVCEKESSIWAVLLLTTDSFKEAKKSDESTTRSSYFLNLSIIGTMDPIIGSYLVHSMPLGILHTLLMGTT